MTSLVVTPVEIRVPVELFHVGVLDGQNLVIVESDVISLDRVRFDGALATSHLRVNSCFR